MIRKKIKRIKKNLPINLNAKKNVAKVMEQPKKYWKKVRGSVKTILFERYSSKIKI